MTDSINTIELLKFFNALDIDIKNDRFVVLCASGYGLISVWRLKFVEHVRFQVKDGTVQTFHPKLISREARNELILNLMKVPDLSQNDIAKLLDVSQATILLAQKALKNTQKQLT